MPLKVIHCLGGQHFAPGLLRDAAGYRHKRTPIWRYGINSAINVPDEELTLAENVEVEIFSF